MIWYLPTLLLILVVSSDAVPSTRNFIQSDTSNTCQECNDKAKAVFIKVVDRQDISDDCNVFFNLCTVGLPSDCTVNVGMVTKACEENTSTPSTVHSTIQAETENPITFEPITQPETENPITFEPITQPETENPITFEPITQPETENPITFEPITQPETENPITFEPITQPETENPITFEPITQPETENPITFEPITQPETENPITFEPITQPETENPITFKTTTQAETENPITFKPTTQAQTENPITVNPTPVPFTTTDAPTTTLVSSVSTPTTASGPLEITQGYKPDCAARISAAGKIDDNVNQLNGALSIAKYPELDVYLRCRLLNYEDSVRKALDIIAELCSAQEAQRVRQDVIDTRAQIGCDEFKHIVYRR